MDGDERSTVRVSRRIEAPADVVFGVLADPRRHPELDGSGMLRATPATGPVTAVGDVFVMAMSFPALGDYEMNNHVVEFEPDRRIGWEPEPGRGHPEAARPGEPAASWGHRWSFELVPDGATATVVTEVYDCSQLPAAAHASVDGGRVWIDAMTATLRRLDAVCTGGVDDAVC
jgi:hypothetical protein